MFEIPRPFANLGQQAEHGGRVSFLAGRLARREANLPLRHRKASDGIHNEQHILALIAEIFGDGERDESGAHP